MALTIKQRAIRDLQAKTAYNMFVRGVSKKEISGNLGYTYKQVSYLISRGRFLIGEGRI